MRRKVGSGLLMTIGKSSGKNSADEDAYIGKLFGLLRAFPRGEPTRKRFANEAVAWTARFGEYENGDPDLHHVIGSLYAEGTFAVS